MKKPSVLVIGASGGLANILCSMLSRNHPEFQIIGIDARFLRNEIDLPNFVFKKMRYTRRNFEKLFRENNFQYIYHLGRMSHAKGNIEKRLSFNLIGTNRVLELAQKHQVKKLIILSTFHVYGALSDNPVFINEDFPLRASIRHPELRDVTEMDTICSSWMWKNQDKISTVILRPCNIIGPQIHNTISKYLTTNLAPVPIDFNPMFQFIHEFDMADILASCLENVPTGIYNVAPEEAISLQEAKGIIGVKNIPFPIFALSPVAKIIKKLWVFPDYLIDYVKYSCIIDGRKILDYLPKKTFRYDVRKSLSLLKK